MAARQASFVSKSNTPKVVSRQPLANLAPNGICGKLRLPPRTAKLGHLGMNGVQTGCKNADPDLGLMVTTMASY